MCVFTCFVSPQGFLVERLITGNARKPVLKPPMALC